MRNSARSALVFLGILLAALLAGAGVVALAAPRAGPEAPAPLATPPPQAGDQGVYAVSTVQRDDQGLVSAGPETEMFEFAMGKPQSLLDSEARPRVVQAVHLRPGQSSDWHGFFLDAGTGELLATETILHDAGRQGGLASLPTKSTVLAVSYQTDTTGFPCGLLHTLQAASDRLAFAPRCSLAGRSLGGLAFRPLAREDLAGHDAVVYGADLPGESTWVWVTPDVAYPLLVVFGPPSGTGTYEVIRLARYATPGAPATASPPSIEGPGPLEHAVPPAWGIPDAGVRHPFAPSVAFQTAVAHPNADQLRAFLDRNPRARMELAVYTREASYAVQVGVSHRWMFALTNGDERHYFAVRVVHPYVPEPVPHIVTWSAPAAQFISDADVRQGLQNPAPLVPLRLFPATAPTLASLGSWWDAYARMTGESDPTPLHAARFLAIRYEYAEPEMDRVVLRIRADSTSPPAGPLSPFLEGSASHRFVTGSLARELVLDGQGRVLELESRYQIGRPPIEIPHLAAFPVDSADTTLRALTDDAVRTTWQVPRYAWVASTVAMVLAALVYLAGPGKALLARLPGVGAFFARLRAPEALENPIRGRLFAAIRDRPGIHYRELARQVQLVNGTLEHHLRKLVELGLVRRVQAGGYACYYPKDAAPREAWPVEASLKSKGAQRLLEALRSGGPGSIVDLSRRSQLSPRTVGYHLGRLQAARLVTLERQGRSVVAVPAVPAESPTTPLDAPAPARA